MEEFAAFMGICEDAEGGFGYSRISIAMGDLGALKTAISREVRVVFLVVRWESYSRRSFPEELSQTLAAFKLRNIHVVFVCDNPIQMANLERRSRLAALDKWWWISEPTFTSRERHRERSPRIYDALKKISGDCNNVTVMDLASVVRQWNSPISDDGELLILTTASCRMPVRCECELCLSQISETEVNKLW